MAQKSKLVTPKKPKSRPLSQKEPASHPISSAPTPTDVILGTVLRIIWRVLRYTIVFICGAVTSAMLIALVVLGVYLRIFFVHAGIDWNQAMEMMRAVEESKVLMTAGRTNVLILGTDNLSNRDTESVLTDTILLASVGVPNADVKLISFPRDLWIASQSSKINALWEKERKKEEEKEHLVKTVIEDLSGQPIHHTLVVDMQDVSTIIDILGGLDIDVERSFVDYQFPRVDVDVRTERDPKKLYEVVAFSAGKEHMSGDRVMRYVRSRHSPDPIEGSDDGRVRRQQRVISALLRKLQDPTLIREPETMGKLLNYYLKTIDASYPISELGALAKRVIANHSRPTIHTYQFPIEGATSSAVLMHPNRFDGGAWVYLPIDPTWKQMRATVAEWMQE